MKRFLLGFILSLAVLGTAFADSAVTVVAGKNVTIALTIAAGTPPLTYQWAKNGTPIAPASNASATASALQLPGVTPADSGTYTCVVSNAFGSATSDNAVITVGVPPSGVATHPSSN